MFFDEPSLPVRKFVWSLIFLVGTGALVTCSVMHVSATRHYVVLQGGPASGQVHVQYTRERTSVYHPSIVTVIDLSRHIAIRAILNINIHSVLPFSKINRYLGCNLGQFNDNDTVSYAALLLTILPVVRSGVYFQCLSFLRWFPGLLRLPPEPLAFNAYPTPGNLLAISNQVIGEHTTQTYDTAKSRTLRLADIREGEVEWLPVPVADRAWREGCIQAATRRLEDKGCKSASRLTRSRSSC